MTQTTPQTMSLDAALKLAVEHHASMRLTEAEEIYRAILQVDPRQPDVNHNLGVLAGQVGQGSLGLKYLQIANSVDPTNTQYFESYAESLLRESMFAQLEELARATISLQNNHGAAWKSLGVALQVQGKDAFQATGRAAELLPADAAALNNHANALLGLGKTVDAIAFYRRAIGMAPTFAQAQNNLALAQQQFGFSADVIAGFRKAIEIAPSFAEAHSNLGFAQQQMGDMKSAYLSYQTAYELGYKGAKLRQALALPPIMGTWGDVLISRKNLEERVDFLIANPIAIKDPVKEVATTPFYLAFHGLNDRELQLKIARMFELACPSLNYVAPHCMEPAQTAGDKKRRRIAFLTKFALAHSISLCYAMVMAAISSVGDSEVFLITSTATSSVDVSAAYGEALSGGILHISQNMETARQEITNLSLDVLIYLDIGMEPQSYFLAFSRLAPVQIVLGGHPVTTGIKNLDYFVSTLQMEADALQSQAHYSEKLVCLKSGLFYFERPVAPNRFKSRAELGLPTSGTIYMCPMKLQKIHPDFDAAIARILSLDADGWVVLFEDDHISTWKSLLQERFLLAMPAELTRRIIFMPWILDGADFLSAIAAADVVLDPFHFGIGSTAISVFAVGTPLVTRPSEYLRGRVGMGFCNLLGLEDCVLPNTDTYAKRAVEIGNDHSVRAEIKNTILASNHKLFNNTSPIDEFVDFLKRL